jgi:cytoskeletal protein RodZ
MAKSAEISSSFIAEPIGIPTAEPPLPNLVQEGTYELSFGQYLRRERILRGISRKEIIAFTKVREEYLDALENNQFERLPPKAFVMGFLRVFSKYAGLDGDAVVNRYLTAIAHQEAYEEKGHPKAGLFRRNLRMILALSGLACLLLAMFFPYFRHRA